MTENLSKLIDILCSRIAQPDVIKISFLLKLICLMSLQLKPHWGIWHQLKMYLENVKNTLDTFEKISMTSY